MSNEAMTVTHDVREEGGILIRESYVYRTNAGAVEGWRAASPIAGRGYYGGIEVHSATPFRYAPQAEPSHTKCRYTPTGECWHDGSSMAFEDIEYGFDSLDFMQWHLKSWHDSNFQESDT